MRKRPNIFRIVMLGTFTAIAIILTLTPLGYISTPFLAITTVHIPIIVAAILFGPVDGSIVGAIIGILCMVKAAAFPTTVTDWMFVNPVLSLVPRILIGLVTAFVFIGVCKLFRKSDNPAAKAFSVTVAAVAGTLTNTVGVLTALGLLYPEQAQVGGAGNLFTNLITTIFATNGLFEIVAAIALAVPIVLAVDRFRKRRITE